MLLESRSLLALAVLLAGVGTTSATTLEDKKDLKPVTKDEAKKEQPKKDEPKKDVPFPDIEELMKKLPPGLDLRYVDMIRRNLEMARRQVERSMDMAERARRFRDDLPARPFSRPGEPQRLGLYLNLPTPALAEQLSLPRGQGLVIDDVVANSPAAKAGIRKHDILLELAGKPVTTTPDEIYRQVRELKANTPFDAVVLRKGKKETIKGLTVPEVSAPRRDGVLRRVLPRRVGEGTTVQTLQRTGDRFTLTEQSEGRTIQLRGKVADGKAQVEEVRIVDRGRSNTYASVEKVPAEFRDKVNALLESATRSAAPKK